jgi:hypothetical protein
MDFQQVTALGIVAVAAGSLALRLWRQARGGKGGSCGGCGECGRPSAAPKATPLITLRTGSPDRKPVKKAGE